MPDPHIKRQIAKYALEFVEDDLVIGLGSGTTAEAFIRVLAEEKPHTLCVASSKRSEDLATSLGLHCLNIEDVAFVDKTFDGADQVDDEKRLIKGKGGCLLREKILIDISRKVYIMIEETKRVPSLGNDVVPCEITPWGHTHTVGAIRSLGFEGEYRKNGNNTLFLTENNNLIFDVAIDAFLEGPEELHTLLKSITGIVETGLFTSTNPTIIIGLQNSCSIAY